MTSRYSRREGAPLRGWAGGNEGCWATARPAAPPPTPPCSQNPPTPPRSPFSLLVSSLLFSALLAAPLSCSTFLSHASVFFGAALLSLSTSFTLTLGTACSQSTALFFAVFATPFLTHLLDVVPLATLRMLGHSRADRRCRDPFFERWFTSRWDPG